MQPAGTGRRLTAMTSPRDWWNGSGLCPPGSRQRLTTDSPPALTFAWSKPPAGPGSLWVDVVTSPGGRLAGRSALQPVGWQRL